MYPEIEFINTSTDETVKNLIKSYEEEIGGTLYPADPKRLFLLWIAEALSHIKVVINETAKQNVPRYAKGEYLDSLGELLGGSTRLEKEHARATFEFTISAAQTTVLKIDKGTRISVDGDIMFETVKEAEVKAGETKTEVIASCTKAGIIGNGFIPGQITELIDIFPFYKSVKNITTSNGGAERETDEAYYKRMKDSTDSYSTAGPEGAYKYHIKSISSLIGDVSIKKAAPGELDIRLTTVSGDLPSTELIEFVKTKLEEGEVRPLTDKVVISAPTVSNFDIDITYYVPKTIKTEEASSRVKEVIENYVKWQTEKLGRDINPSYLIAMLINAGISRVDLRKPVFKTLDKHELARLGNKNLVNGGVEDE